MKNRINSWNLAANLGELDLDDDDCDDERSVPGIYNYSNATKRSSMDHTTMFKGDSSIADTDLYTQSRAAEKRQSTGGIFSTKSPFQKNKAPKKKDPLMAYLENRSKAHDEYKKRQNEAKRRQELEDLDDDKSLASSSSFFDFFSRPGALDDSDDEKESTKQVETSFQEKVKRSGSVSSLFNFFQDIDKEEEITTQTIPTKQSPDVISSAPVNGKKESSSFEKAIDQSDSVNGSKLYRRGKRAADRGDWKKAVAYYHIALVKQREYYGENHAKTAETLNDLGLALMNMGEYFGAMTALEESLHIRQNLFGAGAEEVALTTNNIWLVLRASQEDQSNG